jgi:hypothetical protein
MLPKIVNGDPDCKYKLVYNGEEGAIETHESQGWQRVLYSKDGPRLSVGKTTKAGEPIEFKCHTLMDIHKDDFKDIQDEGQKYWDQIEEVMVDRKNGPYDASRGMRARTTIPVVNETKANVRGFEVPEEKDDDGR